MKKAKTIIASLIVMLASIFVGACSCDESNVPQVYVKDIDIRCLTESESVSSELDANSGILNVYCHVDDVFAIEYNLTPSDATVTQVNWVFSDKGLVSPKNPNEFARAKSTTEIVEFVAKGRSAERFKTTLTFTANIVGSGNEAINKKAYCNIVVYEKVSELPTFVEPTNLDFDNSNNRLTWNAVTQVITSKGIISNANLSNGYPVGLSGYEIVKTDLDSNLTTIDTVAPNVTEYSNFTTGVNYDVKVRALGDGNYAKTGEYTDGFKFYKLNEASELSNNDGLISFKTPLKSSNNKIYYLGLENDNYIERATTADTKIAIRYSAFNYTESNLYKIQVVSEPSGYDEDKGYAELDGVRYYPSTPSTYLVIEKLSSPVVTLQDIRRAVTIDGITFTDIDENNNPHGSTIITWSSDNNNSTFHYEISGGDLTSTIVGETTDSYIEISQLTAGKSYEIRVVTMGNASSTITSEPTILTFNIVEHLSSDNVTLDKDIINHSSSMITGGLELFFVYQGSNASTNSKRVELSSTSSQSDFDISKIGLTPGDYKVYGKSICEINDTTRNAVVSPTPYTELMTITVADKVSETKILKTGVLTFNKIPDIETYNVIINQKNSNFSFEVKAFAPLGNGASDDGNVHYSTEVINAGSINKYTVIKIDIYDVFRSVLRTLDEVKNSANPAEKLESLLLQYLNSNNTFTCQVQAMGYTESGVSVVSSMPTNAITFYRSVPVTSTSLDDYVLSFNKVDNSINQQYVISLKVIADDEKTYTFTHSGIWGTDDVTGKIKTDLTKDEVTSEGKTLAELINPAGENWLIITAIGYDGNENSDAVLNAVPCEVVFGVTNQPTDLALDQSGMLTWKTTTSRSTIAGYKYTIKFYKVTINESEQLFVELTQDQMKVPANVLSDTGTKVTLQASVGEILAKYPDEIIAITVEENNSGKYTGYTSDYFYATRISAPVPEYDTQENNHLIVWDEINNASYYNVSVTKDGDDEFSYVKTGLSTTNFSITDRFSDDTPWTEGVYTISIVASDEFTGVSTALNPYVLSSVAGTKVVYIVSGSLNVSVSGDNISWDNICYGTNNKATYVVSYTNSENATDTINDQEALVYNDDNSKISLDVSSYLTAGTNKVTVTPTIEFASTGYIIINTPKENSVVRCDTAHDLSAIGGNLTFKVYGVTDAENDVTIELYQGGNVVPSDQYTSLTPVFVDDELNPYVLYTYVLDKFDEGALTFSIKIKSEGKLDSVLSEPFEGVKIASVSDLDITLIDGKDGRWFAWSSQLGISYYELSYKHVDDENYITTKLQVEALEGGGYRALILKEDTTNEYIEDIEKTTFYYEDGKFFYRFDETLIVGDKTGDFNIAIRPLTEVDGYFNGSISAPVVVTKLNNNTQITTSQDNSSGVIYVSDYEADGSATPESYILTIYKLETKIVTDGEVEKTELVRATDEDGNEIKYEINETYLIKEESNNISPIDLNVIGFLDAGEYEVELTYLGDGHKILDSQTISTYLTKLNITAPSTANGQIVWDSVDNVSEYLLEISDGTNSNVYNVSSTNALVTFEDNGEFQAGQLYTIRTMAVAEGKLNSSWSAPLSVKKLYAPTEVVISRSTEQFTVKQEVTSIDPDSGDTITTWQDFVILTGTPIISWSSSNVTNQSLSYQLIYGNQLSVNIDSPTNLRFALTSNLPIGEYALQIRAIGNSSTGSSTIGLLTSDYSTGVNVKYIQDVDSPVVNKGVITWNDVQGAFSYKVTAYKRNDYIIDGNNAEIQFSTYTSTNSINFAKFSLANLDLYYGNYTFVINAITEPTETIISTDADTDLTNVVSLFKPNVLEDFKVKNGMLNWKVAVTEIQDFVNAQENLKIESDTPALDIIKYVINKINNNLGDNKDLEKQITHLLQVRLNINGVDIIDTPSSARVIKVINDNEVEISSESEYLQGHYIEYSYNVAIDPLKDSSQDENTEDNETEEGTEEDANESQSVSGQSLKSTNTAGIEYVAGRYTIKVSAVGNEDADAPVVNSGYTNTITAFKPTTPKTWSSSGSDIDYGKVQWGLSTTPDTTLTNFVYYTEYKITAVPIDGEGIAYTNISVNDTLDIDTGNNSNLQNNYQYYRYLKDDLFVPISDSATGTNILNYNTYYRLLISTIGTQDSSKLNDDEIIYLNSNACVVGAYANILNTSANIKIQESKVTWNTSYGSTSTRLYVYGPFDNLNSAGTARNANWVSDKTSNLILEYIDIIYSGDISKLSEKGLTDTQIADVLANYSNMLTVIDFAEVNGARINEYTLTDAIYNNEYFRAGGYILKFQEIGDNKGIIDSEISINYPVEKLGTPKMQTAGWVGTTDSSVYVWNPATDMWNTKTYDSNLPNQKVGTFVWNPVVGANAYRVDLYRLQDGQINAELLTTAYTRETRYELESGEVYNANGYKYFVRLTALRTDNDNITQLLDNFFSGDHIDTTSHYRLAIPSDLTIYGDGTIEWNGHIEYENIGAYRIQFNYGMNETETKDVMGLSSKVPEIDLGEGGQNGTIAIAVKAVAESGGGEYAYLNSSYCVPVEVTRLADPVVRLENGVFNWGTGSDPLTASELIIDTNDTEIISQQSAVTSYPYFTDITSYNSTYSASSDNTKYSIGSHTFKVRFQGTGGTAGIAMTGDEDFYIASNEKVLTATKLATPVIENVTLNLAETSENMVKWLPITNALGYRVRIFYSNQTTNYTSIDISTDELVDILNNVSTSEYFVVEGTGEISSIYFKLNSLIEMSGLIQSGGVMYIYVQALGSGINESAYPEFNVGGNQTNTLYLSSSYSDFTTVGVPPMPTNLNYNSEKGLVTWEVDSPNAFGIKLGTSYVVYNVSQQELNTYWKATANTLCVKGGSVTDNTPTYKPYEELISRTVVYTYNTTENTYTLEVSDILYLPTEQVTDEYGEPIGFKTPTSYKLTTIASKYLFSVTAISFANDEEESEFASNTNTFGGNYTFDRFGKGDGSQLYPYTINDYTEFARIRLFTDRHFVLTNDINLYDSSTDKQDKWTTIAEDFTGSINGDNHTISNFEATPISSENTAMIALFVTNKGTISNLNMSVKLEDDDPHTGLKVASIAIYNLGTIDNVDITGSMEITARNISNTDIGTSVGGLVVENSGTISNSSVNATIIALDDSSATVYAGGIARSNKGTIKNTNFAGSIRSNYVGGIVASNYGNIDRCYVDNAVIYVTDEATTESYRKGATAGGIAGEIKVLGSGTASITNSYSKAYIYASKGTSSSVAMIIGGLIGSLNDNANITISNNYVVSRLAVESGKTISADSLFVYDMIEKTTSNNSTVKDNYYIVETLENSLTISSSSRNDTAVIMKDSLETLKTALATLRDDNNNLVYNTDTEYPTLKVISQ
ncbi:MAG: hypothetical protein ACI4PF_00140 [Christensenellales bacterium]